VVKRSPAVLTIGDINIDVVFAVPSYPAEGTEVNATASNNRLGGSGCNTACVLARLGLHSWLAGHLGNDPYGQMAMQEITRAGVDRSFLEQSHENTTGFMFIPITSGGQRTMFGFRGCNALPYEPGRLLGTLDPVDWLHVSGYTFLEERQWVSVREIVQTAHQRGVPVSLDPSVLTIQSEGKRLVEILPEIDLLLVSEGEVRAYAQSGSIQDGLERLEQDGARQVALKLGGKGSQYIDFGSGERMACPPFRSREVTDTTGAGDSFNAGFIAGRLKGLPPEQCLELGNALAFLAITSGKGVSGLLDLPDISDALNNLMLVEPREGVRAFGHG
jgi:ribokinase